MSFSFVDTFCPKRGGLGGLWPKPLQLGTAIALTFYNQLLKELITYLFILTL